MTADCLETIAAENVHDLWSASSAISIDSYGPSPRGRKRLRDQLTDAMKTAAASPVRPSDNFNVLRYVH